MRLAIIPVDKTIVVDNEVYTRIESDLSWIPSNVHALQWDGTSGEVEYNDGSPNTIIEELGIYEKAFQTVEEEKIRFENEKILEESSIDYIGFLRTNRNMKLSQSDWTQGIDSPLTEEKKAEWRIYRQALRDLPNGIDADKSKELLLDPNHSDWPVEPN